MHESTSKECTGRICDVGMRCGASPASDAVCDAHGVLADEIGVLADLNCEVHVVRGLCLVEAPVRRETAFGYTIGGGV